MNKFAYGWANKSHLFFPRIFILFSFAAPLCLPVNITKIQKTSHWQRWCRSFWQLPLPVHSSIQSPFLSECVCECREKVLHGYTALQSSIVTPMSTSSAIERANCELCIQNCNSGNYISRRFSFNGRHAQQVTASLKSLLLQLIGGVYLIFKQ